MTTEEKLQNFYNHSLDSANREAERVIGDHQKALDKIFEEHKATARRQAEEEVEMCIRDRSLAYCDDCGHQELDMDVCPVCGSKNLTKIDRMNGYLSYSRVHGDTRLNEAKMAEIAERKSM